MKMTKFKNPFAEFSTGKLFMFVVSLIVLVQVISLIISSIFQSVPLLRAGYPLVILSAGLAIVFLVRLVFKKDLGKIHIFLFFILIALAVVMYMFGTTYFPQIFSFNNPNLLQSVNNLQSIIGFS